MLQNRGISTSGGLTPFQGVILEFNSAGVVLFCCFLCSWIWLCFHFFFTLQIQQFADPGFQRLCVHWSLYHKPGWYWRFVQFPAHILVQIKVFTSNLTGYSEEFSEGRVSFFCKLSLCTSLFRLAFVSEAAITNEVHKQARTLLVPRAICSDFILCWHAGHVTSRPSYLCCSYTPLIDYSVMGEFVSGQPSYRFIYEKVRDRKPSLSEDLWAVCGFRTELYEKQPLFGSSFSMKFRVFEENSLSVD